MNLFTYNSLDSDANFVNSAGRLRATSYRMALLSNYIVLSDTPASQQIIELKDRIDFFDKLITYLIDGDTSSGLKKLTQPEIKAQLEDILAKWKAQYKPDFEIIATKQDKSALMAVNTSVNDYVSQIDKMVSRYSEISQQKVLFAKTAGVIVVAISILLMIISLLLLRKWIINPINIITYDLKNISSGNGDLTKIIKFESKDEIGDLTGYFNQFVASIREIIMTITKSSIALSSSMDAISGTSNELAKSTEMIASAVQDVSSGSVEQSDMVNNMTLMVNQMTSEIENVNQYALSLLYEAEASKNAANDGNQTIRRQVEELSNLVQSTHEVSNTVNRLEQDSQDIQSILEIIGAISNQTNLLALNAAIEAARAGEAGKGFSVVADEIRKLADETSKSTVRIIEIVQNITEQTHKVKVYMDNIVQKIGDQEKSMDTVQAKLGAIAEKSNVTFEGSKAIQDINSSIHHNFTAVNESTASISRVVEKNSQNTQDVAAAVEEQTASFQEIAANLSSLSELSYELNLLIGKFKT